MSDNDHGWTFIGISPTNGGMYEIAPSWPESLRCNCGRTHCHRKATQEDLLCDECRETCR